jgi:hypothetical protein
MQAIFWSKRTFLIFVTTTVNNFMKFRQYFLLTENDPNGGMPPMGADPGAPPAAGAPPMAPPPPGGGMPPMGADPMMGGMGSPPGGSITEPPVIPKHADVWAVLDHLLNKKPIEHDKQLKQQKSQPPSPPPMGGMGGMPPMNQQNPGSLMS